MASLVASDPLHQVMRLVSYWCITMASKMAGKYGAFSPLFLHPNLLVHRGNTEQILARWRRPVASVVALDPLHWEVRTSVLENQHGLKWVTSEVHSFVIDDVASDLELVE